MTRPPFCKQWLLRLQTRWKPSGVHCTFRTYGSRSPGSWDSLSSSSTTALVHALNVTGCPSTRTFIASPQEMFAHLASKCGFVARTAYRDSAMAMVNSRFGFADGGVHTSSANEQNTPAPASAHLAGIHHIQMDCDVFGKWTKPEKQANSIGDCGRTHNQTHYFLYIISYQTYNSGIIFLVRHQLTTSWRWAWALPQIHSNVFYGFWPNLFDLNKYRRVWFLLFYPIVRGVHHNTKSSHRTKSHPVYPKICDNQIFIYSEIQGMFLLILYIVLANCEWRKRETSVYLPTSIDT